MDFESRAKLDQLELQISQLQSQLKEANSRLNDQAGRSQELAAKAAQLEALLVKAVEALDGNTSAFRDTIQILDAKSCVQEAILRDVSRDLAERYVPFDVSVPTAVKRTADGQLDVSQYFDQWKQKLVEEEAKAEDPYDGAVMFGGDYHAQINGPPDQDPA